MLLYDNVVAQRETKTRSFASGLRRKEGIEHLFLHFGRNAGAAVTDPDLHAVAEVFGCGSEAGPAPRPTRNRSSTPPPRQRTPPKRPRPGKPTPPSRLKIPPIKKGAVVVSLPAGAAILPALRRPDCARTQARKADTAKPP